MNEQTITPDEIRAIRKACGWTQQQMAFALQMSVSIVTKWEAGDSRPKPERVTQLRELERIARSESDAPVELAAAS